MSGVQGVETFQQCRRHWRDTPGSHVDVDLQYLIGRRKIPRIGVIHLVIGEKPLGIEIEQARPEQQGIALHHFAPIGHVHIDDEGRTGVTQLVGGIEPDIVEKSIRRMVEGQDVIGDVHMPVVVDPFGQNGRAVQFEGGWNVAHRRYGTHLPVDEASRKPGVPPVIGAVLPRIARNGMPLLVTAMLIGFAVPAISRTARPLLEPSVLAMLAIALTRLNWSALATYCRRPMLAAAAATWLLVISPLVVWAITGFGTASLPAALVVALVVNAGAPPIAAAAAFAQMLGLDAPLTVFVIVATTLLLPLTCGPMLLWLVDLDIAVDLASFYARVALFIVVPFILAGAIRAAASAERIQRHAPQIDGIMVLTMIVFVLGLMNGALARVIAEPQTALLYAICAFALNLALNLTGVAAFWWMGRSAAYAMGLASGSRNMALMVAIAGAALGPDFLFYTAMAQLPIYLMPLIGLPLYRRLAQMGRTA